jgi:mitogen-activated protein kinase kinase kinase 4
MFAHFHPSFLVFRHQVYEACRGFQVVFVEARERAQKALAFAKTLRKDLEVSAEFTLAPNVATETLVKRLQDSEHVRVLAPHSSQHLIFISGELHVVRKLCYFPGYRFV